MLIMLLALFCVYVIGGVLTGLYLDENRGAPAVTCWLGGLLWPYVIYRLPGCTRKTIPNAWKMLLKELE